MRKYILPIVWTIIIFVLSSIPGTKFPKLPFPGFDKIVHFGEYFILGILWAKAINRNLLLIILLGFLFGVSDEIHQIFVPFRQFDLCDLLADVVGIIIGVISFKYFNYSHIFHGIKKS